VEEQAKQWEKRMEEVQRTWEKRMEVQRNKWKKEIHAAEDNAESLRTKVMDMTTVAIRDQREIRLLTEQILGQEENLNRQREEMETRAQEWTDIQERMEKRTKDLITQRDRSENTYFNILMWLIL
jgi:hypothetical protein